MIRRQNRRTQFNYSKVSLTLTLLVIGSFFVGNFSPLSVTAASNFNQQINYQGKLTDSSNVTVANGLYNMQFKLYTSATGGAAIWTETDTGADKIQVTSGLFSVMLGSTTPFTNVNFNQTLYLGVNIGGSAGCGGGFACGDGEMTPRKVLGAIPAAFEALNLGGASSTQYLRSDQPGTLSTSSSQTALSIIQSGAGNIFTAGNASADFLSILNNGNVGIGSSTPIATLSVKGSGSTNPFVVASSSGSQLLTLLTNGKFGIGSSSPAELLTVAGNGLFTGLTTVSGAGTSTFSNNLSIGGALSLTGALFDSTASPGAAGTILKSTGSATQWVATSTLGLLSSSVTSSLSNGFIPRWNSSAFVNSILGENGTVAGVNATSSSYTFNIQGSSGVNPFNVASSTGTSLLAVVQSGNVGIGITAPTAGLHVKSGASYVSKFESTGVSNFNQFISTTGTGEYGIYNDGLYFQALDSLSNGISFYGCSGCNQDIFIAANNNVGVGGDATPDFPLEVVSAFAVSSAAAGDGDRFLVNSSGNVGIGTTTPGFLLTVAGASNFTNALNFNGAAGSAGNILQSNGSGSAPSWVATSTLGAITALTGDATATGPGSAVLTLANSGVTASTYRSVTVDAKGRVTGGTNPTTFSGYAISDTSANLAAALTDETGSSGGGVAVFSNSPSITTPTFITNITTPLIIGGTAVNSTLTFRPTSNPGIPSGTDIIFQSAAGGAENMRILNDGSVGIGTSSPAAKLQVLATTEQLRLSYDSANYTKFTVGSNSSLTISPATGKDVTSSFNFTKADGSTSVFNIDTSNSRVGVASSTPIATLSVKGVAGTNPFVVASSTNTQLLTLLQNGNFGIGTNAPGAFLSTQANGIALTSILLGNSSGSTDPYNQIVFQSSQTDTTYRSAIRSLAINGSLEDGGTLALLTNTAGGTLTERMRIDSSGNVGIGTTTPGFLLTVAGTSNFTSALNFNGAAGSSGNILQSNGSGSAPSWVATSTLGAITALTGDATATGPGSAVLTLANSGVTASTYRSVTVDAKGRVTTGTNPTTFSGYGISDTSANLATAITDETGSGISAHVVFDKTPTIATPIFTTNITAPLVIGGNTSATTLILRSSSNAVGCPCTDSIIFQTGAAGATEGMRILSNGNVGIGTTTPSSLLTISGTTTSRTILPETNLTYNLGSTGQRWNQAWIATLNVGTSTWSMTQSAGGRFSLFDAASGGGTERFTILPSSGFVGIGTATPGEALTVAGNIEATGNIHAIGDIKSDGVYMYGTGYTLADSSGVLHYGSGSPLADSGGNIYYDNGLGLADSSDYLYMGTMGDASHAAISFNGDTGTGIFSSHGGTLNIATGGNDSMKIDSSGYVYIPSINRSSGSLDALCFDSSTGEILFNQGGTDCRISSRRFKHDINDLDTGLSEIMALRPVSFIYNNDNTNSHHLGLIAEEVEQVEPRLVFYGQDGLPRGVQYPELTALLAKGIQQQQREINSNASSTATALSSLQLQVGSLEGLLANVGGSGFNPGIFGDILSTLQSFGTEIVDGISYMKNFLAEHLTTQNLTIKGKDISKTGFTIYDRATHDPICVYFEDGKMEHDDGECPDSTATSTDPNIDPPIVPEIVSTNSGNSGTSTATTSEEKLPEPVSTEPPEPPTPIDPPIIYPDQETVGISAPDAAATVPDSINQLSPDSPTPTADDSGAAASGADNSTQ